MRYFLCICFCLLLSYQSVFANFFISTAFPNTLDDKNLEYIEIVNTGENGENLEGYILSDTSGKEHILGSILLGSGEKYRFFRPVTKLILNNSNEEIFLKNGSGITIDEVSYSVSIKGVPIDFLVERNIVFSDESRPRIFFSDEVMIGEEIKEEQDEKKMVIAQVPEVVYTLQRPSYVTQQGNNFICDTSREICKINFDLRPSFIGDFRESQYVCSLDFGFETSESGKCNPNTIEIPVGEHYFVFRISDKRDLDNYKEIKSHVINTGYVAPTKNTSSRGSSATTQIPKTRLQLMQPHIQIQSGLDSQYRCTKTPCKINLNYKKNFRDERCLWNFGKGQYTPSTRKRCNPGYVTYSDKPHTIVLRVYQKNNPDNFKETKIRIYPHVSKKKNDSFLKKKNDSFLKKKNDISPIEITKDIPSENSQKQEKIITKKETENTSPPEPEKIFSGNIHISAILPNPVGGDIKEWIEIENLGTRTSLEGCYLQRKNIKHRFSDTDILPPQQKIKVHRIHSRISLPNAGGEVSLFCNDILVDLFSWYTKIPEGNVLSKDGQVYTYTNSQDFYTPEYINKISFLKTRVLKTGVKVYGESVPNSSVYLESNQGHFLELQTDENGVFQETFQTGFIPGGLIFTGVFSDRDTNTYMLESTQQDISSVDISSFVAKKTKKIRTKKSQSPPVSYLVVPEKKTPTIEPSDELGFMQHSLGVFVILGITFLLGCFVLYSHVGSGIVESIPQMSLWFLDYSIEKHMIQTGTRQQVYLIIS